MEKKVFCSITPRRKAVKFLSQSGSSDINLLRVAFSKACETDSTLKLMTDNKLVVFQLLDETGQWCDIEPGDAIENLCEIKVVLIPSSDVLEICDTSQKLNDLKPGEIIPVDVNVLYNEPSQSNSENAPVTSVDESETFEDNNEELVDQKPNLPAIKKLKVEQKCIINVSKKSSKLSVLPSLTCALQRKFVNGKINPADAKDFFKLWGEYLYQETKGVPSKVDYATFATTIVTVYPELKGGTSDIGIVRSQLSTWVRNHRTSIKPKGVDAKPNKSKSNPTMQTKPPKDESVLIDMKNVLTSSDIESALKELEKPFKAGKNIAHIKRLLEDIKDYRRSWIEQQSGQITDIIDKYPALQNDQMIIHECVKVIFEKKENTIIAMIEDVIDKLYEYYANEPQEKCSSALSDSIAKRTDRVESMLIEQLYKDLLTKPMKNKSINPLWTTCEVLASTENLKSAELSSPRAILYFSADEILTQAFILAGEDLKIQVSNPKIAYVLLTLMSAYYTWHLKYPLPYHAALDFFFNKVFDVPFQKPNGGAAKFVRILDNAAKAKKVGNIK